MVTSKFCDVVGKPTRSVIRIRISVYGPLQEPYKGTSNPEPICQLSQLVSAESVTVIESRVSRAGSRYIRASSKCDHTGQKDSQRWIERGSLDHLESKAKEGRKRGRR